MGVYKDRSVSRVHTSQQREPLVSTVAVAASAYSTVPTSAYTTQHTALWAYAEQWRASARRGGVLARRGGVLVVVHKIHTDQESVWYLRDLLDHEVEGVYR